jgi:hypothetical protein
VNKRSADVIKLALWLLFWAFVLWLISYGPP